MSLQEETTEFPSGGGTKLSPAGGRVGLRGVTDSRRRREREWNATQTTADELVECYFAFGYLGEKEWLARLHHQISTIMVTNAELQEQLREQTFFEQSLIKKQKARTAEWDKISGERKKLRSAAADQTAQLEKLHAQRVSTELSLWDKEVALHDRVATLTQERARLQDQRRAEEQTMETLREQAVALQQQLLGLKMRKAHLHGDDDSSTLVRDEVAAKSVAMSSSSMADSGRSVGGSLCAASTLCLEIPDIPELPGMELAALEEN